MLPGGEVTAMPLALQPSIGRKGAFSQLTAHITYSKKKINSIVQKLSC